MKLDLMRACLTIATVSVALLSGCDRPVGPRERPLDPALVAEGKDIFRFDTFGDEQFWTDTLRMHEVIQQAVTPAVALSVGLKVDADALPADVVAALQSRSESDDPVVREHVEWALRRHQAW